MHQPSPDMRHLPCGCATCGCLCPDHLPPAGEICEAHALSVARLEAFHELASLLSLTAFIGMIAVWAIILE